MKELLTKSFWQSVKQTYEDALQGATPTANLPPKSDPTPADPADDAPATAERQAAD